MQNKEQEKKCWGNSKDCIGQPNPYGLMETPTRHQFDLCDFHSKAFGEAVRPFVDNVFKRGEDGVHRNGQGLPLQDFRKRFEMENPDLIGESEKKNGKRD